MARKLHLRSSLDLAGLRARWRSEHGPAVHSEAETTAALADVDKDIEDCDAEVDRLQSQIIFIRNQRKRLEEYKTCLRFLRSPIRKIPNETLLRIFDFACDMNEITSKKLSAMPTLSISDVCSRWRNLTQSNPILWSRIHIEIQTTPPSHSRLPLLNLYLKCSRNSPLTFEITGPTDERDLTLYDLALCAAVATHSNRWRNLTIFQAEIYQAIVSSNPQHFPMLVELLLPNVMFGAPGALNRYQNAPNLISLSLFGIRLTNLDESKFPWKQLIRLDVAYHPEGMENLWKASNKLTELRLRDESQDRYQRCVPPVTAPALETLSISSSQTFFPESGSLAQVAFTSLICPSLTSLIMESDDDCPWPKESLHGFISWSSFHLTTLSIKLIPLSDSDLIDLLRRLPELLHLTIHDHHVESPITPLFIQSLHAYPPASCVATSSALIQRLQSLDMRFGGLDSNGETREFSDMDFIDMVSSRWFPDENEQYGDDPDSKVGIACLRSVVMRFADRDVNEETYKPLTYLEKAGMKVAICGAE